MPTPFTHLRTAQTLLADAQIPRPIRDALEAECGAFLLGNIAADARVNNGTLRANTHFYQYDAPIIEHPWRVMLAQHPGLRQATDAAQQAFLAGYVAHLAMDEFWLLEMLRPHFLEREWGASRDFRFWMFHILLIYIDERDMAALADWHYERLTSARPESWLPFMDDESLIDWRDFIARQIKPPGDSQTLTILGERLGRNPADFRAVLDSPEQMRADLWAHITPGELARIEAAMYDFARAQMLDYLREFGVKKNRA